MNPLVVRLLTPVIKKDWAIVHGIVKDCYDVTVDEYENFVCYIIANSHKAVTEDDYVNMIDKALKILDKLTK
jgi:hypothetical protein